jgi:hypothetical protein
MFLRYSGLISTTVSKARYLSISSLGKSDDLFKINTFSRNIPSFLFIKLFFERAKRKPCLFF